MSADIVKFYPQFKVDKEHADFQRLVWREDPQLPLQDFRLSMESALEIQDELLQVMANGSLKLHKWMSNHPSILQAVPEDHRESEPPLLIDQNESVKTIGILRQPNSDTFGVSIVVPDLTHGSSKRKVLSSVARIFDPLGWLSPTTIQFKILMQKLWKAKLDWDTRLPPQLDKKFRKYCNGLKTLEKFRIDRCLFRPSSESSPVVKTELHGFSYASKMAYSACVYVRTVDNSGQYRITLVAAKSKVAPLKTESIPRLELCGAVLLSKLMRTVLGALKTEIDVVRSWTDSTIVLDWLSSNKKLEVFVHNRVMKICPIRPTDKWVHVSGDENPADVATREIPASEFLTNNLLLKGPPWLSTTQFPSDPRVMTVSLEDPSSVSLFVKNCSSFSRIKRVVAYCLRFANNCMAKVKIRKQIKLEDNLHMQIVLVGALSTEEMSTALTRVVCVVQAEEFAQEIARVNKGLTIKSSVKFLTPFMDANGVLRVGGS